MRTNISDRVCKEWLTFSNFKAWMEKQDWEGKVSRRDVKLYKSRGKDDIHWALGSDDK